MPLASADQLGARDFAYISCQFLLQILFVHFSLIKFFFSFQFSCYPSAGHAAFRGGSRFGVAIAHAFLQDKVFNIFSTHIHFFLQRFSNFIFVSCDDGALSVFDWCNLIRGVLMDVYVILLAVTKAGTFLRASCTCGRWCWGGMMGQYFQGRSLNSRQFSDLLLPRVFVRFSGNK